MKVLMISKILVAGAYHKKLEELAELGVDLHVVIPITWGDQGLEIQKSDKYTIYPLPLYFTGKNHFHFYRGLQNIIQKTNPAIIHIDEEHYSLVTFQAMRLAKKNGTKALFFTWQNIYKRYPFPFSAVEQYNFRHAKAAIAGNEDAREVLRKKGFTKEVAVIPQVGVDPEWFSRRDRVNIRISIGIPGDTFVIGFMGRIVPEKGILDLIDAAACLPGKYIILIVGSGPLQAAVMKRAALRGMRDRVMIVGQVSSLDVPVYMNCFDCLVLPSRTRRNWKEQFGRVLIEAMACEVPVIGSDSAEIPRVIGDGGLVFREGDTEDLAAKLTSLMTDVVLQERLRIQGRKQVLARFTQKRIAADTYAVYQKMLA